MAITTYTELKTAIANWLDRDDLTERIPEFIALAEASFSRDFRTMSQEKRATDATVSGDAFLAVPADFLQARNMYLTSGATKYALKWVTPSYMSEFYNYTSTGMPSAFTIIGDEFKFAPTPDDTYTLELDYYAKVPALSDTNTSNWMLADNPDLYLFRSLLYAEPYLYNDERIQTWSMMAKEAMESIRKSDKPIPANPLQMQVI